VDGAGGEGVARFARIATARGGGIVGRSTGGGDIVIRDGAASCETATQAVCTFRSRTVVIPRR
jgi:hypothetical protein